MSNYEYIVASLPDITTGWKFGEKGPEDYIEEIVSLCSDKDRELIGFFLDGYRDESLCTDFYARALTHDNVFIREFFRFDLNVRNTKVNYLNKALDRPAGKDILTFPEETDQKILDAVGEEFEESADLESVLNLGDILSRERGIDDLVWEKVDSLTTFNYFDIDAILGFIAKLNIVARWFKLDEQTGREMFKKLVDEVRGTFKGVEYNG
ncbi:MAG: DUF2764 family protein [Bacteroidales bacterium]|jgi:hypothetical protein|nr:DUF2764 family protein [Bacteroidales bacterium]MBQ5603332.1 DUF2764 family protein [Bacteroidales bacterium]MBQ5603825.1 DUF2764 family protein [Bacteroidales bacterium]